MGDGLPGPDIQVSREKLGHESLPVIEGVADGSPQQAVSLEDEIPLVHRGRGPARQKRPDGPVIVIQRLVKRALIREHPDAPIRGQVGRSQALKSPGRPLLVCQTPGNRDRAPRRGLIHLPAAGIEGIDILSGSFVPEPVVECPAGLVEIRRGRRFHRLVPHRPGQLPHRQGRPGPSSGQVDIRQNAGQGPEFQGSQAGLGVVHQAVAVDVGRFAPGVGLEDRRPALGDEIEIAAPAVIIQAGGQVKRGRVPVDVSVGIILEPFQVACGLGQLVGHLAIRPLPFPGE